jgi:Acetyltransferase (GNAT) domain
MAELALNKVGDTQAGLDFRVLDAFLSEAPIFLQPWWLEASCPGSWGYAIARRGETVAAVLPYVLRKDALGGTVLGMASLTQVLGPWLRKSEAKYANQLAEQKDLMTELIDGLPPYILFRQNFHYTISNWLPFYWRGFKQTTRYTYVLEDLTNLDAVWKNMNSNVRSDIRKAQKQVRVVDNLGLDCFLRVNELTFQRQGMGLPYSGEYVARLDAACAAHGARKLFFAVDAQGRVHAAAYIVWTKRYAYYLMSGGDPALRNSGATSLLVWEAIRFAATVSQAFDFEGSMVEPVERFNRAFCASQKPYFTITHDRRGAIRLGFLGVRAAVARLARHVGLATGKSGG